VGASRATNPRDEEDDGQEAGDTCPCLPSLFSKQIDEQRLGARGTQAAFRRARRRRCRAGRSLSDPVFDILATTPSAWRAPPADHGHAAFDKRELTNWYDSCPRCQRCRVSRDRARGAAS
jgi:hypothetical protein